MSMRDGLSSTPDSIASEVADFAKSVDFGAEAKSVEALEDSFGDGGVPDVADSDYSVESDFFGGNKNPPKEQSEASELNTPETTPAQTIKFKANGQDIELSMEEAQKRLSLAEGARQALTASAKMKKDLQAKDKTVQELTKFKESWDKLEALKHDPKQLLEVISGQSYDDFIQREMEKREIYQYGSDEQKRMLELTEKLDRHERTADADKAKREADLRKADDLRWDAERERVQTAAQREYFKYEFPADMDAGEKSALKGMLWTQANANIREYQNTYGKLTNKMIEKAFADPAALLLRTKSEQVQKTVQKMREDERSVAKEKAQIASTRESGAVSPEVSRMNPKQLFDNIFKR